MIRLSLTEKLVIEMVDYSFRALHENIAKVAPNYPRLTLDEVARIGLVAEVEDRWYKMN